MVWHFNTILCLPNVNNTMLCLKKILKRRCHRHFSLPYPRNDAKFLPGDPSLLSEAFGDIGAIDLAASGYTLTLSGFTWRRPPGPYNTPISLASFSSCACCLLSATWAAITLCLSAISVHLAHMQSLHLQYRLWPFKAETTPWFLQRAHLGVLGYRSVADRMNTASESKDPPSAADFSSSDDDDIVLDVNVSLSASVYFFNKILTAKLLYYKCFKIISFRSRIIRNNTINYHYFL